MKFTACGLMIYDCVDPYTNTVITFFNQVHGVKFVFALFGNKRCIVDISKGINVSKMTQDLWKANDYPST